MVLDTNFKCKIQVGSARRKLHVYVYTRVSLCSVAARVTCAPCYWTTFLCRVVVIWVWSDVVLSDVVLSDVVFSDVVFSSCFIASLLAAASTWTEMGAWEIFLISNVQINLII